MSEWYLFAGFVFLLAAALTWMIKRTPRSEKKREEKGFAREAKLFKLYQNIEDLLDGFEAYVEELTPALLKDTVELQQRVDVLEEQVIALRRAIRNMGGSFGDPTPAIDEAEQELLALLPAKPEAEAAPAAPQAQKERAPEPDAPVEEAPKSAGEGNGKSRGNPLNRVQKVRILHAEGMDAVQIAQKLGLAQNEVNLVLQLENRVDASLR